MTQALSPPPRARESHSYLQASLGRDGLFSPPPCLRIRVYESYIDYHGDLSRLCLSDEYALLLCEVLRHIRE